MVLHEYFAKKWLHTVIVLLLIAVIIAPDFVDVFPEIRRTVLGVAPLIAWTLGVNYERSLVIVTGLVDEDELREVEQENTSVWGF